MRAHHVYCSLFFFFSFYSRRVCRCMLYTERNSPDPAVCCMYIARGTHNYYIKPKEREKKEESVKRMNRSFGEKVQLLCSRARTIGRSSNENSRWQKIKLNTQRRIRKSIKIDYNRFIPFRSMCGALRLIDSAARKKQIDFEHSWWIEWKSFGYFRRYEQTSTPKFNHDTILNGIFLTHSKVKTNWIVD